MERVSDSFVIVVIDNSCDCVEIFLRITYYLLTKVNLVDSMLSMIIPFFCDIYTYSSRGLERNFFWNLPLCAPVRLNPND